MFFEIIFNNILGMTIEQFIVENQWVIWVALIWIIPWKGVALWKAAQNGQKGWFVALLIVNTFAILEIVYIIFFSRKKDDEYNA